MKRNFLYILALAFVLGLSQCGYMGHNSKEIGGFETEADKVWGDKKAPARQLAQKYEDDATGKTAERIDAIRTKLYPK